MNDSTGPKNAAQGTCRAGIVVRKFERPRRTMRREDQVRQPWFPREPGPLQRIQMKVEKMGYSTPKKQLDLKEFLSEPAKKLPFRKFGMRSAPTKPATGSQSRAAQTESTES
ncbi:hypothetical protein [Roseovarius atlanticus]|nr:hypothetical protein [Roseovarius atlanticus]